jgi:large subunit ribosomal protein L32
MVIRMRHTKSHTANRRSHHTLRKTVFSRCEHCGEPKRKHHVCPGCGHYRKMKVVDLIKKTEKKQKKAKL